MTTLAFASPCLPASQAESGTGVVSLPQLSLAGPSLIASSKAPGSPLGDIQLELIRRGAQADRGMVGKGHMTSVHEVLYQCGVIVWQIPEGA